MVNAMHPSKETEGQAKTSGCPAFWLMWRDDVNPSGACGALGPAPLTEGQGPQLSSCQRGPPVPVRGRCCSPPPEGPEDPAPAPCSLLAWDLLHAGRPPLGPAPALHPGAEGPGSPGRGCLVTHLHLSLQHPSAVLALITQAPSAGLAQLGDLPGALCSPGLSHSCIPPPGPPSCPPAGQPGVQGA